MKWRIIAAAGLLSSAATAATPVKIVHNSTALEFSYSWPAEATAVPALDQRFRAQAAQEYREALPLAREDHAQYKTEGRGSVRDFYLKKWTAAGQSRRLLSLQSEESTYTGGAHPNTGYGALLWDRRLNREVTVSSLFERPADLPALTRRSFCALLAKERLKRRGGQTMGVKMFDDCPSYSNLAISPVDSRGNGRFDGIDFVASPYTAGPYVEGEYEIVVPVTSRVIAALKPQYRSSFEVHRQ